MKYLIVAAVLLAMSLPAQAHYYGHYHGGYGWRGGYHHGWGWRGYGWRGYGYGCRLRCDSWHCWRVCW